MNTSRRALLGVSAAFPAAVLILSGCIASTSTTDAQILADASGVVASLLAVIPTIPASLLPTATAATTTNSLQVAQSTIGALAVTTPAQQSATAIQVVDQTINNALQVLAVITPAAAVAFPPLAAAVPIIEAVNALLPGIEAFINTTLASINSTTTTPTTASAVSPAVVLAARKKLGIPAVK